MPGDDRRFAIPGLSRTPRAYRPGALLQNLRHDFAAFNFLILGAAKARIGITPNFSVDIQECVEAHFLMHIVSAEFSCSFVGASTGSMTIAARHRGFLQRSGVNFVHSTKACPVKTHTILDRLRGCTDLTSALMKLDFTAWELEGTKHGWTVRVRHFGASEVAGQLPSFRRYVPLAHAQREALVASMLSLRKLLAAE